MSPGFEAPGWLWALGPLWLLWALTSWRASRSRWLRFAMVTLAVVLLARPVLRRDREASRTLVLVDRSRSMTAAGVAAARDALEQLASQRVQSTDEVYAFSFGRGASLIARPGETLDALAGVELDDESDVAAGLRLALTYAEPDLSSRIVLISDGLYTGDEPASDIATLRARGVPVYVLPSERAQGPDVAITRVVGPRRVPRGHGFALAIEVQSPDARPAVVGLRTPGGAELERAEVELEAGLNRFSLPVRAGTDGLLELVAFVETDGDPIPENDLARKAVRVEGVPRLVLVNSDGRASALARALEASGLELSIRQAARGLSSADLSGASVVVLENVSLSALGDGADRALDHYVRHLGGGLLVTGGRQSYAMGGYFRSQLEELLPVVMDRKEELRRPRVALALVLDRSGSMGAAAGDGTKMDLANRGAAEAISLLAQGDRVSVVAVDSAAHVVVPLTELASDEDRREVIDQTLRIESMGGGIFVHTALAAGMDELLRARTPTRHLVLFSDASDSEQPGNYRNLVSEWSRAGGSLSVIGLGTESDSDAGLLKQIADLGGGRIYFTNDATQLPRVFAQDVMYVARKTFVSEVTAVDPGRGSIGLDLPTDDWPSVGGYNLCYLAEGAELVLASRDDNAAPIGAAWQRGTGRVLALTFEADGPHTGELAAWPGYQRFFASAVEWLETETRPTNLRADLTLDGRRAVVSVELDPREPLAGMPRALLVSPEDRSVQSVRLGYAGPNLLTGSLPIDSRGVYHGVIEVAGVGPIALPPVTLPHSPEFQPVRRGQSGLDVLIELSENTGGGVLSDLESAWTRPAASSRGSSSLGTPLGALLLALLPLEIARRRGLLDAAHARVARAGRRLVGWLSPARWARARGGASAPLAGPTPVGQPAVEPAREPAAPGDEPSPAPAADAGRAVDEPLLVAKRRARKRPRAG